MSLGASELGFSRLVQHSRASFSFRATVSWWARPSFEAAATRKMSPSLSSASRIRTTGRSVGSGRSFTRLLMGRVTETWSPACGDSIQMRPLCVSTIFPANREPSRLPVSRNRADVEERTGRCHTSGRFRFRYPEPRNPDRLSSLSLGCLIRGAVASLY